MLFWSTTAAAATVPELTIEELTDASDAIVVGEVVSVDANVEGRWVVSTISVSVSEVWKGKAVDMIQIRHRGGRTAKLATVVPGMPQFAVGERAVLFLEARRDGGFVTTGLAQGKFSIAQAPDGTDVVFPTASEHQHNQHDHGEPAALPRVGPIRLPATARVWTIARRLDDLRTQVNRAEAP
jgi:hypothetical protein